MTIAKLVDVWNLPAKGFPDRATTYWDIVSNTELSSRPLDFLEIGVLKAGLLRGLQKRTDLQIKSYTGVDPYAGDERDYYRGGYWKNQSEASEVYEEVRNFFSISGHQLIRSYSHEYYKQNKDSKTWDLIIVDGDHRYPAAFWDLHHWFKCVKPGGILMADDYANSDTPEVTRAVNDFIRQNKENILKSGYKVLPFQNKNKEIPISLTIVYFMKTEQPIETKSWAYNIE